MYSLMQKPICDNNLTEYHQPITINKISRQAANKMCPMTTHKIFLAEHFVCPSKKVRVAKVLRSKGLNEIPRNLLTDPTFKIIYLVRDPRAVFKSRSVADENYQNYEEEEQFNLCEDYRNYLSYRMGLARTNSKLLDRIFLVRYEDFIFNPISITKKIFQNTANITFNEDNNPDDHLFLNHILKYMNDHFSDMSNKANKAVALNNYLSKKEKESNSLKNEHDRKKIAKLNERNWNDEYLSKQRERHINKNKYWIDILGWNEIDKIQESCYDVMKVFGYKIFETVEDWEENYHDWSVGGNFEDMTVENPGWASCSDAMYDLQRWR